MCLPTNDWNGCRVTVMGLGRFGGGVGVVQWLARQGALVTLTDQATVDELAEPLEQLRDLECEAFPPVKFHLGGHDESDFADAQMVVVNPAVRPDNRWVRAAIARGVPVNTEIGLFLDACPASVIGVTGSNGKSTTASMLASILCADGRKIWLGGNLGGSLLGELASMTEQDWVVLELSSFQITYLPDQVRPPQIVVVTNCVPNHLDWHDTFDEYASAKRRLLQLQTRESVTILDPTLAELPEWTQAVRGRLVATCLLPVSPVACDRFGGKKGVRNLLCEEPFGPFRQKVPDTFFALPPFLLSVPGEHNRQNARAAATAAVEAGCTSESIERGLMTYLGLPDRLEPVGVCHGRRCVNDTASTTPESTAAAAAALPSSWLLVGGGDKGANFSAMLDELARSARGVAFYGTVGPRLYERFQKKIQTLPEEPPQAAIFSTLDEAFSWSLTESEPGETIILSPGCSSHDQFPHFVARGDHFKRLVSG